LKEKDCKCITAKSLFALKVTKYRFHEVCNSVRIVKKSDSNYWLLSV